MQQPYWSFLYSQFVKQTDPAKMSTHLEQLESAIFARRQELEGMPESYSHSERLALEAAWKKLLEIKTNKLGFPPVGREKFSRTSGSKDGMNTRRRGLAAPRRVVMIGLRWQ